MCNNTNNYENLQNRINFHANMFFNNDRHTYYHVQSLLKECINEVENHSAYKEGYWSKEETIKYTFEDKLKDYIEDCIYNFWDDYREALKISKQKSMYFPELNRNINDNTRIVISAMVNTAVAYIDFKGLADTFIEDFMEELENERL